MLAVIELIYVYKLDQLQFRNLHSQRVGIVWAAEWSDRGHKSDL